MGFYVLFFFILFISQNSYVLTRPVIANQPFEMNCFAISTKGFKQFECQTTGYFNINLSVIMTTIPLARPISTKWFQMHCEHCFVSNSKSFKSIFIGDSLIVGLHRYYKIRNNFFKPIDAPNRGVGGCNMFYDEYRIEDCRLCRIGKKKKKKKMPSLYVSLLTYSMLQHLMLQMLQFYRHINILTQ